MGDAHNMDTEDILAEPDEVTTSFIGLVLGFLHANGWYIILAALGIYFYFKSRVTTRTSSDASNARPKSEAEIEARRLKEEQRLKAIERLQAKYAQDAAVKAERQKELDEQKRKARLEEKEKLTGLIDVGRKLGDGDKKSFKPEYNPLMGDQSSSGRVCYRRPGGGGG